MPLRGCQLPFTGCLVADCLPLQGVGPVIAWPEAQMVGIPSFEEEKGLWAQGYRFIAGVDEVGRGPLAGPLVAAAIILPRRGPWLDLVRDSKRLTPSRRELLFERISQEAVALGIGTVAPEMIDAQGIIGATRLAMGFAIAQLSQPPDFLLVDALALPEIGVPQRKIIMGDSLCLSIAAASVVAKVTRDRLMAELDSRYPGYGFARHKGYGTREHLLKLRHLGPCPIHRKSFSPVRELLWGKFLSENG